jgi:uncharacterized glyoxalase superfamily protein PhnB
MLTNRSIPRATVIPVLAYRDVHQAADWLCEAFGFTVRLSIANHRVQLNVGDGAVIVRELRPAEMDAQLGAGSLVMIRIDDLESHCKRAIDHGARVIHEPCTYPYGERQYTVQDFSGYSWTFSQTITEVEPETWGGTSVSL